MARANKTRPPEDGVERKCWACKTVGLVLDAPVYGDGSGNQTGRLWFYKCPNCGARLQWVYNPRMDGSAAEKHKDGLGFCTTSMLSDPDCRVVGEKQRLELNPVDMTGYPEGTPLFVYDEDGRKTHRWHWGRMEWREIEGRRAK